MNAKRFYDNIFVPEFGEIDEHEHDRKIEQLKKAHDYAFENE